MIDQPEKWDTQYEWKAVLLLCLGFGLVGLDRWVIAPLFPAMMADLKLTYQDLGNIAGVLAITWGVFAMLFGRLSDKIGRRKVLLPSLILFSLLSGLTGVAGGVLSLLLVRGLMGTMEGAYCAASVAATGEASAPKRRGMNQGLQMSAFPLLGFGLGPILATQLLEVLPSWRWVFVLVGIPGLIIAFFMWRVIREPAHLQTAAPAEKIRWAEVFRSRNMLLAMLSILCAMSCIFVLGAMVPSYLVDYLKISPPQMGLLMSALGFGGFLGDFAVAGLSDYIGRRLTAVISFAGAAVCVYLFSRTGADFGALYALLFLTSVFCFGVLALMTGPVATEAVPTALVASGIGLVTGTGEIFGGGIAPVIGGFVAQNHGIQNVLYVGLVGLCIGFLLSFLLKETAPRRAAQAA